MKKYLRIVSAAVVIGTFKGYNSIKLHNIHLSQKEFLF